MSDDTEAATLLLVDAIQQLLMSSETHARRVRCALDSIDAARTVLTREP